MRRLAVVLVLVLLYMGAEVVGGIVTGSLALLADAGHMLSDAGALGLALFATWMARKPRSAQRTFGFHRTEILAALANGLTLVAVAMWIVVEAFHRLDAPPRVDGRTMLWIAVGGLAVNAVSLFVLHGGRDASLNLRGAWLHVATDALGSLQAIVAGFLVWQLGWHWADPVASILIALLVVASAWSLTREAVHVLMEGAPRHIDSAEVRAAIVEVPGVVDVHDLHVWTITSGFESLSVHARVGDRDRDAILADIRGLLRDRFHLEHSTVQLEDATRPASACGDGCCD
jgi:cobalt-zinc-cadmium efflux system protein